jgi:hypothetical protein
MTGGDSCWLFDDAEVDIMGECSRDFSENVLWRGGTNLLLGGKKQRAILENCTKQVRIIQKQ